MPPVNSTSSPPNFEAIFSATASAYLILDPALTIVEVNDAYLRATERTRNSVMGKHVFDAFPASMTDPDALNIAKLHSSFNRVLETRARDEVGFLRYDIPIEGDESGLFEERYWSPINTPLCNDRGEVTHIIHHAIDITSNVLSDRDLRASEERYGTLFSTMDQGFCVIEIIFDVAGKVVDFRYVETNPRFEAHTGLVDVLGKKASEVVSDLDRAWYDTLGRVATTGAPFRFESVAIGRWFDVHATPVGGPGSNRMALLFSDITQRKANELELREAARRKDEFLAMLAHELRNPLAPIGAGAKLLQMGQLDETRVRHTSEIITRQVSHMSHLIDDLLDVSRVTRGLVKLDNAPMDMRHVVAEAVEQVNPIVKSKRHHLTLHLPPDTAMVMGDKNRLVQIVANLLNNAAKYTPEGGSIVLRTEVQQSHTMFEISDSGIGMEPDLVNRVFDLFAQAERTPDRSSGGLGLGLALVKTLVELHGGSVKASSGGIGNGSKFTVCLPRLHGDVEGLRPTPTGGILHSAAEPLRILVVDDNVDAAEMLGTLLETLGHEIFVEHGARRALERASIESPDVCILDIGLPEIDGNELAKRLRVQPETENSVMIAVTGYGHEADRNDTLAAGFNHHLVKPIDFTKLAEVLEEVRSR